MISVWRLTLPLAVQLLVESIGAEPEPLGSLGLTDPEPLDTSAKFSRRKRHYSPIVSVATSGRQDPARNPADQRYHPGAAPVGWVVDLR